MKMAKDTKSKINEWAELEQELIADGFSREEASEIILRVIWGDSIDSAIQSLFI